MKSETSYVPVLFIICLASSLVPFMSSALNLALPYINKDLSLDAVTSGWIPTSYMLSTAIFQIPCARMADMLGRKRIFMWGVFIFGLFSILSGLTSSIGILIIYRFLAGVGSAMMFGTSTAILTASVPAEKRGQALGITTSTVYMSLAAGPFIGGILTQYFNWHSIFFVLGFVSLIVGIGGYLIIKDNWKEENKSKFDIKGSILFGISLFSIIYGFSRLPHIYSFILIGIGIISLITFGLYEKKEEHPVFNIKLFLSNRVFRLSSISALINYSATFAISFMLSLYLQSIRGLSPGKAGLILIVQSVIQAIASLQSGKLSDRMSPSHLATGGMAIICIGLVGLCFIDESTSFCYIAGVLALLGLGFGTFSSPNANIIMSSVEKKHYSMASATMGTMRLTGQAFSMGIAMMAISMLVGNVKISEAVQPQFISSMHTTFIICLVLCIVGVYASSVRNTK